MRFSSMHIRQWRVLMSVLLLSGLIFSTPAFAQTPPSGSYQPPLGPPPDGTYIPPTNPPPSNYTPPPDTTSGNYTPPNNNYTPAPGSTYYSPTTQPCPNGTSVPMGTVCPTTSAQMPPAGQNMCPNGTSVPYGTNCPPSTQNPPSGQTACPNGSYVPVGTACPTTYTPYPTTGQNMCPNGTTVPYGTNCPSTPYTPYTTPTSTFPGGNNTSDMQTQCVTAGNEWCLPPVPMSGSITAGSGWCVYKPSTCPINDATTCRSKGFEWCLPSTSAANANTAMGTGWCANSPGSECPINDQATCTAKGKSWCTPDPTKSPYGMAYCMMGGMGGYTPTAPWGFNCTGGGSGAFTPPATPIPYSPTSTWPTTPQPVVNCPDGSMAATQAACPSFITCGDGRRAVSYSDCTVKEDNITSCLRKAGLWCRGSSASESGYCSKTQTCSTLPNPTEAQKQEYQTPTQNAPDVSRDVKDITRLLTNLKRAFTKSGDKDSLAKVTALEVRLQALPKDETVFDTLQLIRDEISALNEIQSMNASGPNTTSAQDAKMQARALKQLQQGVKTFTRQIKVLETKIAKIEKGGVKIPTRLLETIANIKLLLAEVNGAKDFDTARDAAEALRDEAENLNELLPLIEQYSQLPKIISYLSREVTAQIKITKKLQTSAKRYGDTATEAINKVLDQLNGYNNQLTIYRRGEYDWETIFSDLQNMYDGLQGTADELSGLQVIANLKSTANKMVADTNTYNKKMIQLKRAGEDTTEVMAMIAEMRDQLAALNKMRVTADSVDEVMAAVDQIQELANQIEEILGITNPNELERLLKAGPSSTEQLKGLEMQDIEKLIVRTYHIGTLYSKDHLAHNLAFGF